MSSSLKAISSPLVLEPAPPGGALAEPHGGKRRLDHVGGAQVLPALGRKVEEGKQALPVGNQRLHGLGVLGLILGREALRPRTRRGTRRTSSRAARAWREAVNAWAAFQARWRGYGPSRPARGFRARPRALRPRTGAPSPTATTEAALARRLRSCNSAFHASRPRPRAVPLELPRFGG